MGSRGGWEKPGARECPEIQAGVIRNEVWLRKRSELTLYSHRKNNKRLTKAKMRVGELCAGWHCGILIMNRTIDRLPVHPWSDGRNGHVVVASGGDIYTHLTFPT
jgi:hypothetical protein